jgi:DNA-binding SARP family transcriptional activator/ABC-type transport system substrate-binding protein
VIQFRILGPLEVGELDRAVPLGGAKQRAVLAVLLLHRREVVSTDRLIDALWGSSPPATAVKTVQGYISNLRKALGDGLLATRGGGYALDVGPEQVDADRFERLTIEGCEALERGDAAEAAKRLRAALGLWRGEPLADLAYEDFARDAVGRLEEARLAALEDRIDADLALGRHTQVVGELEALVSENPYRERLQGQLMLALYRCGRQADALERYRRARQAMVDELGIEPSDELKRLHRAILAQDPELQGPGSSSLVERVAIKARVSNGALLIAGGGLVLLAAAITAVLLASGGGPQSSRLAEDSVGLIDSGGAIREDYAVGRGPGAIVQSGNSLWVANTLDGTVTRLERGTNRTTTIDVGADPTAIAAGAGSVWVASGGGGTISQIDRASNKVVQRIKVGGQPTSVAVGAGAVWVAMPLEGEIARIDLTGDPRPRHVPLGGSPAAIAVGAGAVWVADRDAGRVLQIEPRSLTPTRAINVGNGPASVAVGAGAVWVANRPDGTVSRIDPRTAGVTGTVAVGTEAGALAVGPDVVWVADGAGASLARLDAAGQLTKQIPTATSPSALAADGDSVWVTALAGPDSHVGGTLRVEELPCPYKTTCADPAFEHSTSFDMLTLAYDGLTGYRRAAQGAGDELVGALATDVPKPTDGGRRYVFTLRPGLRYSNGRRVRASDFRASLERTLRLNGRGLPDWYSAIVGAPACLRRPARCDLSRGIATDEESRTVTIRLSRPDPDLPYKLAEPAAALLPGGGPKHPVENAGLPGTGPYRIASVEPGGSARLVRNRYFAGRPAADRPAGFADEIVIRRPPSLKRRLAAVERGKADIVAVETGERQLPQARVQGLLSSYAGRYSVAPELAVDMMFLNVRTPPFNDPRVRRAVNLATDRRRMVAFRGGAAAAEPACQLLPAALPGYSPRCPFTRSPNPAGTWRAPDLRAARRLISASGTRGMSVRVWTDADKVRFGRYFVDLLDRLGYRTSLRVLPIGFDYFHAVGDSRTRAQIGMFGWLADYPTPANFFDPTFSCRGRMPASPDNLNLSQLCDHSLDRAVKRAQRAGGVATAWRPAERRLEELAPAVPLDTQRRILLTSKRTGNVQQNPMWGPLLELAWVR